MPTPSELPVSALSQNKSTEIDHTLGAKEVDRLKMALGLLGLRKVHLRATLTPLSRGDFSLTGTFGGTVIQPCGVTQEPVTTRIDASVERLYRAQWKEPSGQEMEMPEDDREEPLPEVIDLNQLITELLALEIPAFPRKEGLEHLEMEARPAGAAAIDTTEPAKPFAGLAALKAQLSDSASSDDPE